MHPSIYKFCDENDSIVKQLAYYLIFEINFKPKAVFLLTVFFACIHLLFRYQHKAHIPSKLQLILHFDILTVYK